ncbi:MAG: hypothetical protein ACI9H6_000799 [Patiriisocius sp.]|jgi:hypothetical protein
MKLYLSVALLLFLLPSVSFAQVGSDTDQSAGGVLTEGIVRILELQKKFDSGSISETELQEYAALNDGDVSLAEYRPVPQFVEEVIDATEIIDDPIVNNATMYVQVDTHQDVSEQANALQNIIVLLSVAVGINLLLTLYIMVRIRFIYK